MDIVPDLLEEIFIRLPLKSILKFKTVSKQWRSILESKMFVERHMKFQKSRKILAAYNCDCGDRPSLLPDSRFEGEEEIVYLHCDATRPSMSCDGLICTPEPNCINVLNPSTGKLRRIPSGPDPMPSSALARRRQLIEPLLTFFPGDWAMGFGRDKVTGRYKIVKMRFDPVEKCNVVDVETGEWRKLSPPPYKVDIGRKSVCVNGSIYWLQIWWGYKILAFDLHTEEFHDVLIPPTWVTDETQLVNLEDRLAIADTKIGPEWKLEIWSMDAEEERWSKTYFISLASLTINAWEDTWFAPLTISNKSGNLVFYDNHKRLFKYYPVTDEIRCLSSDICVISPYLENLVPLRSESGDHHHEDYKIKSSRCGSSFSKPGSGISKFLKGIRFRILDIVFATLVIAGYIWIPI